MTKKIIITITIIFLIVLICTLYFLLKPYYTWFVNAEAFWNYPALKDVRVVVDPGDVVFYDELNEPPQYVIDDRGRRWFGDSFAPIAIGKLEKYMKENNLCILPGEYYADTGYRVDELIELLKFDDAGKYREN